LIVRIGLDGVSTIRVYAEDRAEIERLWDGLKVDRITGWALRVEVRLAQLNKGQCPKHRMKGEASEVPIGGEISGDDWRAWRTFQRRIDAILRIARQDEQSAFNMSCLMRELIAEGLIGPNVAIQLLTSVGVNRRTIAAGFLTVEDKLEPEKGKCV
jgi:hypothetical protein